MSSVDALTSTMESRKQNAQKTKWVQKCMNINYPHYCQMEMQVEFRNQSTYLKSMAADIVASVKEEQLCLKQCEEDQKRKVKDDLCKDCDKIHSTPLTSHKCEHCT
jgi:hypothetical protein